MSEPVHGTEDKVQESISTIQDKVVTAYRWGKGWSNESCSDNWAAMPEPPWEHHPLSFPRTPPQHHLHNTVRNQPAVYSGEAGSIQRTTLDRSTPFIVTPLFCQRLVWRWPCDHNAANETWEVRLHPSSVGRGCVRVRGQNSHLVIIEGKPRESERTKPNSSSLKLPAFKILLG